MHDQQQWKLMWIKVCWLRSPEGTFALFLYKHIYRLHTARRQLGPLKILFLILSYILLTLSRPLGIILPKRIHPEIPPISPRRRRDWAGLHAADTVRHASIDFFTYLDDQGSRQSGLCPSRERSVPGRRGHMWGYRSLPAVLKGCGRERVKISLWLDILLSCLLHILHLCIPGNRTWREHALGGGGIDWWWCRQVQPRIVATLSAVSSDVRHKNNLIPRSIVWLFLGGIHNKIRISLVHMQQ